MHTYIDGQLAATVKDQYAVQPDAGSATLWLASLSQSRKSAEPRDAS